MEREEHPLVEPTEAAPASEAPLSPSLEGSEEVPLEPWPLPEPPESPAAEVSAERHAEPSPESSPGEPPRRTEAAGEERNWIPLAVGGGLLLLVLLGIAGLWQTRSQLSAARSEIAALKESARRTELLQARSAIVRARADLEPLREVLPSELAAEVQRADGILAGVADRLKGSK